MYFVRESRVEKKNRKRVPQYSAGIPAANTHKCARTQTGSTIII